MTPSRTPNVDPSGPDALELFAVAAPGLEAVVAAELRVMAMAGEVVPGGVAFRGDRAMLYDVSLRLRTATRVLVRVAEFRARTFWALERRGARVDWTRWLAPGRGVELRVSSGKSRLYHEGAIAQRLMQLIGAAVAPKATPPDAAPPQRFIVRLHRDICSISADASGEALHRRGYRLATGRAPLRETLAAAMLMAAGWTGDVPLLDPLCGSGTIAIEAALLARRIAPGLARAGYEPRHFAFMDWPGFDQRRWSDTVARARAEVRSAGTPPILASDRDAGAIEAARGNAGRAGVADDVAFSVGPLSGVKPGADVGPGWLITNPPYGVRIGEAERLRDLYAALGRLVREQLAGWNVALLSASRRLDGQLRLRLVERLRTRNGGLPVRLLVGAGQR
jgi:putative N6-adenine-specific DNA methylase